MNNKKITKKHIKKIVKKISEKFDVEKIILFGSYVRGNANENSDVDLLVIMNTNERRIKKRYEIYRSLTPINFALDIIVRTENDIKTRIPQGDWFLKEVIESGEILYAK